MSRAFTPPDTMTKEDIRAVADVRREVWKGGFKGLGIGLVAGFSFHYSLPTVCSILKVDVRGKPPKDIGLLEEVLRACGPYSRNHRFLFTMMGGAVLSNLLASTAGKNSVWWMHDVFERGKKYTPYQQSVAEANARAAEAANNERVRKSAETKARALEESKKREELNHLNAHNAQNTFVFSSDGK